MITFITKKLTSQANEYQQNLIGCAFDHNSTKESEQNFEVNMSLNCSNAGLYFRRTNRDDKLGT